MCDIGQSAEEEAIGLIRHVSRECSERKGLKPQQDTCSNKFYSSTFLIRTAKFDISKTTKRLESLTKNV